MKKEEIYRENSDGISYKLVYNERGSLLFYEDSNGYCYKNTYNEQGFDLRFVTRVK